MNPEEERDVGPEIDDPPPSLGLGWRIAIGVVALSIILGLGYSFIQDRVSPTPSPQPALPTADQARVAEPEATAQANPESAEAQFELGNAYYEAGQWGLASQAYLEAIDLDSAYQAAYANLGATYYQQQQFDLAIAQYKKALELDPEDGESAYNLGAIYLQQAVSTGGSPDANLLNQSIEQIRTALTITPQLAEPHFSLGVAYMASNRPAEAIEAFETFLSLDSGQNVQARQDAQRYLDALQGQ